MKSTARFWLIVIVFFAAPSYANEPNKFETSNTPIAEFVSWFASKSGQTIVLGQGVTGTVSFTAPDLKTSEYPAFFNSVLRSHGYKLDKQNQVYVVNIADESIKTIEPASVKLYRLEHVRNTKVTVSANNSAFFSDLI